MKVSNINNNDALELAIEDYCNHIEDERYSDDIKWRFIMRREKLDFLCVRGNIRVDAFVCEYKYVLANYDHLLPFALTTGDENISLIKIISKYTNNVLIDQYGGVYFDLKPFSTNDDLMNLKCEFEDYWKTHPLCSNKVDKYRRIVVKALDSNIYIDKR